MGVVAPQNEAYCALLPIANVQMKLEQNMNDLVRGRGRFMAKEIRFVDDFFESESESVNGLLKNIDQMSDEELEEYGKHLDVKNEEFNEYYETRFGKEKFQQLQEQRKRDNEWHPTGDGWLLIKLLRDLKYVQEVDIEKILGYFGVEEVTDNCIVWEWDTFHTKTIKYEYILKNNEELSCTYSDDEIAFQRDLLIQDVGKYTMTDKEIKDKFKNMRAPASFEDDNRIAVNMVVWMNSHGFYVPDYMEREDANPLVDFYKSLSEKEQLVVLMGVDNGIQREKFMEEHEISENDYTLAMRKIIDFVSELELE